MHACRPNSQIGSWTSSGVRGSSLSVYRNICGASWLMNSESVLEIIVIVDAKYADLGWGDLYYPLILNRFAKFLAMNVRSYNQVVPFHVTMLCGFACTVLYINQQHTCIPNHCQSLHSKRELHIPSIDYRYMATVLSHSLVLFL